jgi:hypothetical protein
MTTPILDGKYLMKKDSRYPVQYEVIKDGKVLKAVSFQKGIV